MNTSTATTFGWLVRREYWESRKGFLWAPFWTGAANLILIVLALLAGEVTANRFGSHVSIGISLDRLLQSASANDLAQIGQGMDAALLAFAFIISVVLTFVVFFYLLGALYDDRRDRSVLFWKSLPISDTATVLSKVVSAILVAPLIAIVVILAAFLGAMVIASLWLLIHGANPLILLWSHGEPFGVWLRLLATIPINAIWALPTVGWLLFWSAAARGKPFLWALLIPVVFGVLNGWVGLLGLPHIDAATYWGQIAGRLLLSVIPVSWLRPTAQDFSAHIHGASDLAQISYPVMGHALLMPQMWIGAAVGIILIAAAIWFRRWRDDA